MSARLRYRTATSTPARPTLTEADVSRRASKLPSMLWASWMLRLLPAKTVHQARIPGIRRACATLMLLPGTPVDQRHAAQLLGRAAVSEGDRHNDTAPDATGLFDTTTIWACLGGQSETTPRSEMHLRRALSAR